MVARFLRLHLYKHYLNPCQKGKGLKIKQVDVFANSYHNDISWLQHEFTEKANVS